MTLNIGNFVSVEQTSTTTVNTKIFPITVESLVHLTNDGANDVVFYFNGDSNNAFTLKAGESISNIEMTLSQISYKTNTSTSAFRFLGVC